MPEKDLDKLLAGLNPQLNAASFVFCSLAKDENLAAKLSQLPFLPQGTFSEAEGMTLIVRQEEADSLKWPYSGLWSMITCQIESDLLAVGFLAKIATALAAAGIPCNAIAAYYHDHIFVPADKSAQALSILNNL
jgi:hypothetical protein